MMRALRRKHDHAQGALGEDAHATRTDSHGGDLQKQQEPNPSAKPKIVTRQTNKPQFVNRSQAGLRAKGWVSSSLMGHRGSADVDMGMPTVSY